jgi:lysophospholipase L1-like esterase
LEYRANLQTLIEHFKHAHPSAALIVISPSTCDPLKLVPTPEDLHVFAGACLEAAESAGVFSIDAWTPITEALQRGDKDIFTDGLHLGARGYAVSQVVDRAFRELNHAH